MSVDVKVHYLKDYQPADFEVRSVYLEFDLTAELTRVISRLQVKRVSSHCVPLVLDGEALVLESVALNGLVLAPGAYQLTPKTLTLYPSEIDFELEICTLIYPPAGFIKNPFLDQHIVRRFCTYPDPSHYPSPSHMLKPLYNFSPLRKKRQGSIFFIRGTKWV